MADFTDVDLAAWRKLAAKELKGGDPDQLVWQTPEGIGVKALYSAEDLEGLETLGGLPGFAPYLRGPPRRA
jgi:methylmalonyl-CoA mutase